LRQGTWLPDLAFHHHDNAHITSSWRESPRRSWQPLQAILYPRHATAAGAVCPSLASVTFSRRLTPVGGFANCLVIGRLHLARR
jgi:hypothetical protein